MILSTSHLHYAVRATLGCVICCMLCLKAQAQVSPMETDYLKLSERFEAREKGLAKDLKKYLKQYPYTTYEDEVHFMIGAVETEAGHYKQALKDLDMAEYKRLARPHQAEFLFYRGYSNLMQQEYERAAIYFGLLRKNPSEYQAQGAYYYAYCQYKRERYDDALPVLLTLENNARYSQTVPYYIVQIYYAKHEYDEVKQRAESLLERYPEAENNGELHRILGEIYYQQGDYTQAIRHLNDYAVSFRQQGYELVRNDVFLLGTSQYQAGDYAAAIQNLKQVRVQADTIMESTYMTLGHAYRALGKMNEAKMSYQSAAKVGITPTVREEAMYNYTLTTYDASTALGESVIAFTDFLQQYPNSKHEDQIYQLLSDALRRSKNYVAALDALNAINKPNTKMQETKQYLRYQLGTDAFLQGKMEVAKKWMTEVLTNKPATNNQLEARYWRAEAEYRLREYATAEHDVVQFLSDPAARKSANYSLAIYLRAYALFSQGKYNEAEPVFQQYQKLVDVTSPTYADALNRLGDCAFNARQFERAITYYNQVATMSATGSDYATFQKGYAEGLLRRYETKIATMRGLANTYPKSDYADDALYEIARAELQRDNERAAITAYEQLLQKYPNSNMARKSSLELAMLYRNVRNYDQAIEAYKRTINNYPGSEEAYSALAGLEATYVETNNIAEYLKYTKQLGKLNMSVTTKEDSLSYAAAELQYMLGNYREAAASLTTYLSQYCAGGRYCTSAQYYAADSYYRLGQLSEALAAYKALVAIVGNPYMEEACTRAAEISYDRQDYNTAMDYFYRMLSNASSQSKANIARLGVLRCSYYLGRHQTTIDIATQLLADASVADDIQAEARYNRAKAYVASKQYGLAIVDLTPLAKEVRTAEGAESKYLLAECYYQLGALDNAEQEIMSFTQMNTQQQYWLARALILLADINTQRGDTFQARQYLLSLQANYRQQDDIQQMVADHLKALDEREKEQVE